MKEVIKLILKFREENSEKIWYGDKKLINMRIFFKGYLHQEKIEFLPGFDKYVKKYFHLDDNENIWQDWVKIINFFGCNDEVAFEYFYEILDLYINDKEKDM